MMKRMKIIAAVLALFMLALTFTACGTKTKTAVMTIEGYGDITIELDYGNAPKTAAHFEKLAKEGLLDGTDFRRALSFRAEQIQSPRKPSRASFHQTE